MSTPLPPMDARPLALTASCKIARSGWRRSATSGHGGSASSARYWPAGSALRHGLMGPPEGLSGALTDVFQMHPVPQERVAKSAPLCSTGLNSYLNPMFNHVRNSLLTPKELDDARVLARSAADRDLSITNNEH